MGKSNVVVAILVFSLIAASLAHGKVEKKNEDSTNGRNAHDRYVHALERLLDEADENNARNHNSGQDEPVEDRKADKGEEAESRNGEAHSRIETRLKQVSVTDYLKRYGYLDYVNQSGAKRASDQISTALKRFQKFMHLPQTGIPDKDTMELMAQPRCGHPDIMESEAAGKRFILLRGDRYIHYHNDLTYEISNYTSDLPKDVIEETLARAFKVFSDVTPLTFTKIEPGSGQADIVISFMDREHMGVALGHASAMHGICFDNTADWTNARRLLQVMDHELGHNLGLSHSDIYTSIMQGYKGFDLDYDYIWLHADDIAGVQSIYGPNPAPTTGCPDGFFKFWSTCYKTYRTATHSKDYATAEKVCSRNNAKLASFFSENKLDVFIKKDAATDRLCGKIMNKDEAQRDNDLFNTVRGRACQRWEPRSTVPDDAGCRITELGQEYQGDVSITVGGITCQRWDSQQPHTHAYYNKETFFDIPAGTLSTIKNFCRNTDGIRDAPWCFTTDPNKKWDYCPVPFCYNNKPDDPMWVGLTDTETEGEFVWNDDNSTPLSYDRWLNDEEPSSNSDENCVLMFPGSNEYKFSTAPCDIAASFVCEIPATCPGSYYRVGPTCYKMHTATPLSYSNAAQVCESNRAELATLILEQDLLDLQNARSEIEPQFGSANEFWVGLTDTASGGVYVWGDELSSELAYDAWAGVAPSGNTDDADCVVLAQDSLFKTVKCDAEAYYICEKPVTE